MSLFVLEPGLLTTVQDQGRVGHRHLGVGLGGAVDTFSSRVANLLVGNDPGDALLEVTLQGPSLRFERAARIAICGAECAAAIDAASVPTWRAIEVARGAVLRIGACRRGARAYVAIDGGIGVEPILTSRSTDLRAGFGGVRGRALQSGDILNLGNAAAISESRRPRGWVDPSPTLDLGREAVVGVLPGRDRLAHPGALHDASWGVAASSDRQGLRLEGPGLALARPRESVSEPVVPGTIQLPPQGGPIVLLADAQTVGGYPVIGVVARADLPRLAQCRPGESLRLRETDVIEARAASLRLEQHLARIAVALSARL